MKDRLKSQAVFEASCAVMPGGVSSPVRSFKDVDLAPLVVSRGKADTIWDVDGHAYIDFCCSWGALILGHSPKSVVEKACEQMHSGSSFGITTPYEKQCAEKIVEHLASIEKLRFVCSGTEATMSAIRLARGFTGRLLIVKFDGHYHGHHDALLIAAGSGMAHLPQSTSLGVALECIQHTISLPFNALEVCRDFLRSHDNIAAVILEPIAGNMGVVPAKREFLEMLREETQKKGILLIFDEVITGFRVGLGGAQGLYQITPDISCLGKIIGGGFPAAAFGGKAQVMDLLAPLGGVYQAGTLSGNPVAMCAAIETLNQITQRGFYESLKEMTHTFLDPIRQIIKEKKIKATLQNVGSMFSIFFGPTHVESREDLKQLDFERFRCFFQHCFNHGLYLCPSPYEANFLSTAHTQEHLLYAQKVIVDFFLS